LKLALGGDVCVSWQDRAPQSRAFDVYSALLHDGEWRLPDIVSGSVSVHADYRELSDLSAIVDTTGRLHVVWSGFGDGETRALYYARRDAIFKSSDSPAGR
jgi:hypothetical protein